MTFLRVPPKRIILREKQMADRFYFIVSGQGKSRTRRDCDVFRFLF